MEKQQIKQIRKQDKKSVYDLFFLCEKNEEKEIIKKIENILKEGKNNEIVEVREENFKLAYPIKNISENYQYTTIIFSSSEEELVKIKKEILERKKIRHILLNLNTKKNKIKTKVDIKKIEKREEFRKKKNLNEKEKEEKTIDSSENEIKQNETC